MTTDDSMLGQNLVDVRNEERRNAMRGEQIDASAGEIMIPVTGELINLAEPVEVCRALDQVRDIKRQLDDVRAELEHALRAESERQGTKTLHLGGWTAVVSGGEKTEYVDLEALADELRDEGMPEERIGEIVVTKVSYSVNQAKAKYAAAANPRYAEVIGRYRRIVPAAWRVATEKKGTVR